MSLSLSFNGRGLRDSVKRKAINWELFKFETGVYLRKVVSLLAKKRRVLGDNLYNLIRKLSQSNNFDCMSLEEKSEICK